MNRVQNYYTSHWMCQLLQELGFPVPMSSVLGVVISHSTHLYFTLIRFSIFKFTSYQFSGSFYTSYCACVALVSYNFPRSHPSPLSAQRHKPSWLASSSSSSGRGPSRHLQCSTHIITTKPHLTSHISLACHSCSSSLTYVNDGVTNEAWDNLDDKPAYNTYEF